MDGKEQISILSIQSAPANWARFWAPLTVPTRTIFTNDDALIVALALCFSLLAGLHLDVAFYEVSQTLPRNSVEFFAIITEAGKSEWTLVPAGVYLLCMLIVRKDAVDFFRLWIGHAAFIFFTGAASGLLCNFFKNLIGRARPHLYAEYGPAAFSPFELSSTWQSWPSGHSTTIAAFFTWLAFMVPAFRWGFLAMALVFGLSRVIVNAHFLSDVIAGLALGYLFTLITARYCVQRNLLFKPVPGNVLMMVQR